MRYMHAIPGTAIGLVVMTGLNFFLPRTPAGGDVNIVLTISTFLFAILAGFFIARLAARYDSIRMSIASEDAEFLSAYYTMRLVSKRLATKMANALDHYYISAYDFYLSDSQSAYKATILPFRRLWELLDEVDPGKHEAVFQSLVAQLTAVEHCRNQASVVSEERMTFGSWLLMLVLAAIILVSVFYVRTDALYSQFVTVGLSTALVMVMLTLRDLQNMMLGGKSLLEESGQEMFEAMGKLRYYHASFLRNGISRVPSHIRQYRMGSHVPGSPKHKIKVVKR